MKGSLNSEFVIPGYIFKASAIIFLLISLLYLLGSSHLETVDEAVMDMMNSGYEEHFETFFIWISAMGGTISMLILSSTVSIALLSRRKYGHMVLFISSMLMGLLSFTLLKLLFARPRPDSALISAPGYGFPSGHSTIAVIFFCSLIHLFSDHVPKGRWRSLFRMSGILFIILIGASRLYLRVHWFSDVVAGYSLGLIILFLCWHLRQGLVSHRLG